MTRTGRFQGAVRLQQKTTPNKPPHGETPLTNGVFVPLAPGDMHHEKGVNVVR